jgi:exodeoxyribonuclease III
MTLINWNCQGAFRNKYPSIFAHHPDILVFQESEHTTKLTYTSNTTTQSFWYGDNVHKGISIHTFGSYSIKPHKSHNPDLKYIIPK